MTFQFPGIPYRCILCGECCREPWALRVDTEALSRLEAIDWPRYRSELPRESEAELFPAGEFRSYREKGEWKILPRVSGRCVYLEEKGTCFLHRTFGADIKPNACVEFPYAFVETPGCVFVGLSFVCRSVREAVVRIAEGGTVDAEPAEAASNQFFGELEEAFRRSSRDPARRRELPESIRLQEGIPLSWDDYVLVEAGLSAVLESPDRSLSDRLVAGEVFLGLLADYLRAMGATQDVTNRQRVLEHYVEAMRAEDWERLFRIAAKIRPNERMRQLVTSLFRAFAKFSEGQWRRRRGGSVLLGCAWVWRFGGTLFRSSVLPKPDPVEEAILSTYVQHVVWRKGLLVGASPYFTGVVRRGYAHLLVTVALIMEHWSKAMARQARREALLGALRVVERDFVLHGAQRGEVPVQELIGRYRFPLQLLDSLTHRRFFARSMVG